MPNHARPPDRTSRVVTVLTRSPGCRYETPVTNVPSVIREVTPAANDSAAYPSSISFSGGPSEPIWKKWSITHRLDMPTPSASRTIRAKVGPIPSGLSGQVQLLTVSPSFMC